MHGDIDHLMVLDGDDRRHDSTDGIRHPPRGDHRLYRISDPSGFQPVSYTNLDVYKRQLREIPDPLKRLGSEDLSDLCRMLLEKGNDLVRAEVA